MSQRILMIAPEPFFSPRGTPFSVYYRLRSMSRAGMGVDLLTYGEGEAVSIPNVRVIRIPRLGLLEPIAVGPSWSKVALDGLMVCYTVWLLLVRRYRTVHAHEEAVFWCAGLKRCFGFRLIYDMHSSLAEQIGNFGVRRGAGVLRWLMKVLEGYAVRSSDVVIVICQAIRGHVREAYGVDRRVFRIENTVFDFGGEAGGVDAATAEAESLWPGGGGGGRILYAGTLEHYQGIEMLVEALAGLRERGIGFEALIVGGDVASSEAVGARVREAGLGGVCGVRPRVRKAVADALRGQADVVVSPRLHGVNVPLKVYEMMMSGRPIVATDISSHRQVLSDREAILVSPEAGPFSRGLEMALGGGPEVRGRVARARRRYERRYHPRLYQARVERAVGVAMNGNGGG